jgi:hypothetical protein
MLMIRSLRSGPSALLKTTMMTVLLLGAAAVGAQTPDTPVAHGNAPVPAQAPPGVAADSDPSQVGYHDLICKPNGTEDGFDCADEATPAKIVPIPSGVAGPRPQDVPVIG